LLRAVRRLISTVALQAVIAACRWRRHGLDLTAWLTSEATQDPGKVEICPVRTTDALAPVSGSRQLACGVARARQETNSDISGAGGPGAYLSSGMTRRVARLVDEGLVRRDRAGTDARGVVVALTEAGIARLGETAPSTPAGSRSCSSPSSMIRSSSSSSAL